MNPENLPFGKTVVLCTICHTGTIFFHNLLKEHYQAIGFSHVGRVGVIQVHISRKALDDIRDNRNRIELVTTIRNWDKVCESWRKRKRIEQELETARELWNRLLDLKPIIVSVDDDRERRLKELSAALGKELVTDWKPVNQWQTTPQANPS